MLSYCDVLESMRRHRLREQEKLEDEDAKAMEAIRAGTNLRKPDCGDFWDDFTTIIGNVDAMSALLEVPKHTITGWTSRINDLRSKVDQADSDEEEVTKKEMLPTGNSGPTIDQENQPPFNMRPEPS
jgi:hypothetical protein